MLGLEVSDPVLRSTMQMRGRVEITGVRGHLCVVPQTVSFLCYGLLVTELAVQSLTTFVCTLAMCKQV